MADSNVAYRAVMLMIVLIGIAGVALGFGGLYVVLTGGTTDGTPEADVLGEYECTSFEGDPEPNHDTTYQIERTLVGGSGFESFDAARNDTHLRIELAVEGELLGASASSADGTALPVRQSDDGDRVIITDDDPGPIRAWIDSLSNDSRVTRTEIEICPPE